jgi:hypothetical protein
MDFVTGRSCALVLRTSLGGLWVHKDLNMAAVLFLRCPQLLNNNVTDRTLHHESFVTLSVSNARIIHSLFQKCANPEKNHQDCHDALGGQDGADGSIRYVNCTVLITRLIVTYARCINCLGCWLTYTEVWWDSITSFTISYSSTLYRWAHGECATSSFQYVTLKLSFTVTSCTHNK